MDEPVTIHDAEDAKILGKIRGRVEFQDVSFRYEEEKPVLEHVNFVVEPGESVALVGPTGAGKSTIVNLIPRFYDLKEGKILILDEATSSIDVKTEKALQAGLNTMLHGRTSFIIAHRLSTIKNCDKIMFIDQGQIMECGTHDELMAKKMLIINYSCHNKRNLFYA